MAESSAGALLRAAREKQGLHIAALAAAIKVPQKKLEALEADRWDELAGVIFTRALAQSVCRTLRVDAKPVLALLPQAETPTLEMVTGTLNAPFRDGGGRDEGSVTLLAQRVLVAAAVLLLLAAAALFVLPSGFWRSAPTVAASVPNLGAGLPAVVAPVVAAASEVAAAPVASDAPAAAASDPAAPAGFTPAATATLGAAAVSPPTGAAQSATALGPAAAPPATSASGSPVAPVATGGALRIEANAPSWVEVRERGGRVLLSRQLAARESVAIDGPFPLAVTVGNASGTKLTLRGTPVDLMAVTRNNVARIEVP